MHIKTTASFEAELKQLFGDHVRLTCLMDEKRMGRRISGIDLTKALNPEQALLLVELLDSFSILTFPGQKQERFKVRYLERLANHFGAPIPHPKNYANYMAYQRGEESLRPKPFAEQTATVCSNAFPGEVACLEDAESPAVYIVNNLAQSGPDKEERIASGLHWHTDIEFEPVPLSTSMFYVHTVPGRRDHDGHWVRNQLPEEGFYHPDSDLELNERRLALPLNGETAYADTAAAFGDLPEEKRCELDNTMVRRRLKKNDEGWLVPLVYTNPRNGVKSLHSPIWASRGKNIAPAQVEGLSPEESRLFFDDLEKHCLDPKYRYDHVHQQGDVTIWSNLATLHNAPPAKSVINSVEDARLMYRISCKGEPSYTLPRNDSEAWIESNITPPYRSPSAYVDSGS